MFNIIKIDKLNVCDSYKDNIMKFYKEIKNILQDNLMLFMITGSVGIGKIHEGWSDIDILIVTKSYIINDIKKIQEVIIKLSDIKIGTTIYSQKEFENNMIDGKTMYSLLNLYRNNLHLNYYNTKLKIPVVTLDMMKQKHLELLPDYIHKFKRLVYINKYDKKTIIKTMNLIMKIYVVQKNVIPKEYEDVFNKFSYLYNFKKFDISKELNLNDISKEFEDYLKKFIEFISNNKLLIE